MSRWARSYRFCDIRYLYYLVLLPAAPQVTLNKPHTHCHIVYLYGLEFDGEQHVEEGQDSAFLYTIQGGLQRPSSIFH